MKRFLWCVVALHGKEYVCINSIFDNESDAHNRAKHCNEHDETYRYEVEKVDNGN